MDQFDEIKRRNDWLRIAVKYTGGGICGILLVLILIGSIWTLYAIDQFYPESNSQFIFATTVSVGAVGLTMAIPLTGAMAYLFNSE